MSFDTFLEELADPGTSLAISKLVMLSNLGPEQASSFLNVWLEMDAGKRRRLLMELIDLAEDNVELNFDAVFFAALGDADAEVRRHGVRGLWEYEGRDLIDALVGLLERDPDADVRAEAALQLGRFVIEAEFDHLRSSDAARVYDALRHSVDSEREVADVRARALEALGARADPSMSELIERQFRGPDQRMRLAAVHAMGRSCDAAWLPSIVPELESENAEMRFEAATAAGATADESAVPHLIPLLEDGDAEVQQAAINALGEIGGKLAKRALERVVSDGDERVRDAAADALAEAEFADDPLGFTLRS